MFYNLKKFFIDNNFFFITLALFLCFEPTINQWNRVLYSETIFFSIQLLIISILFNYKETNYIKAILLGILISLMYLQRSVSIYYILIIFIYLVTLIKKNFLIDLFIIATLYAFTHLLVGFHNHNRGGTFYSVPILQKEDLYGYFIPKIIKYNKDPHFSENFKTRHDILNNFVKFNNLKSEKEIIIDDRLIIAENNSSKAFELIFAYPMASIKEYFIAYTHYLLLKHNEMHFLFENERKYNGNFYLSKKFNDEIFLKVFYSALIYLISLFGLFYFIVKKLFNYLFILLSSIIYFSVPVAWHTQSSYLSPILIYLSIFFSAGLIQIISILKNFNK